MIKVSQQLRCQQASASIQPQPPANPHTSNPTTLQSTAELNRAASSATRQSSGLLVMAIDASSSGSENSSPPELSVFDMSVPDPKYPPTSTLVTPDTAPASSDHPPVQPPVQPATPLAPIKTQPRHTVRQSSQVSDDAEAGHDAAHATAGVTAKFLVNTAWATAVIGRGGCNVRELSSTTGCHIQLSDKTSFYPGTKSRVLLLRGDVNAIHAALAVVLRRRDELPIQAANPTDVDYISMLVPTRACGELLASEQIDALERTTGAVIAPAQREKQGPFVPDRVVRITGTREQITNAVMALLGTLTASTEYKSTVTGLTPFRSVTITIPNKAVGVIMGKGGEAIEALQNAMGVSMSMSADKNNPARELAISGLPGHVAATMQVVADKVRHVVPSYQLPQPIEGMDHQLMGAPSSSLVSSPRLDRHGSAGSGDQVVYWAPEYAPPPPPPLHPYGVPPPMGYTSAMAPMAYPPTTMGLDALSSFGWQHRGPPPPLMMGPPRSQAGWLPYAMPPVTTAGMYAMHPHHMYAQPPPPPYPMRPSSEGSPCVWLTGSPPSSS